MLKHLFDEDGFYGSKHADEDLAKVHNMSLYGISDTATLKKAFKSAAEEKPNQQNLQYLVNCFEAILLGYRLLGQETQAEEHWNWEGQCTELMARLGWKVVDRKIVNVDATHMSSSTIPIRNTKKVFCNYQQSLVHVRADVISETVENNYDNLEMEADVAAARVFNAGFHPDVGCLPGSNKNGCKPTWHQLVGATEIVQCTYVDPTDPKDNARRMLLADKVGLGKTGTIIVTLQLLWHLLAVQDAIKAATRVASLGAGNKGVTTPPPCPRHLGE
ncbi:hypothetical protein FRC07_002228 [Ceratobasidium sp. 392]|nr:hypothetical protein FRC07_002228 [Ceratobasidium sp. 392]